MNNRQRIKAVLNYENYDRLPIVHFGFWDVLVEWAHQGHLTMEEATARDASYSTTVAQKLGFDLNYHTTYEVINSLHPFFEYKVVEEFPNGDKHIQGGDGVVFLSSPGAGSIPMEVKHLLTDRQSYEKYYKPRAVWMPERIPENIDEKIKEWNSMTDAFSILKVGSVIGDIRNWLGVVGLSYMQYDDPELLKEIVDTYADMTYRNIAILLEKGLRPDCIHWWEDVCFKNGPLVSPDFFREYAAPHYKKITGLFRKYGVNLASVDCDGMIEDLMPIWLENNVNVMFPIEIGTWNPDFTAWRKKYGKELRGVGGMDKRVLTMDKAAVDQEIERLKPWIALGGYIPCPDHNIVPGSKWELVQYYTDKLRNVKI